MSSIILQHVDFNYDGPYNDVFTDLSLVMDTSWRTGLVGRNGQGKSTLLNLLAGHLEPSAGSLELSEQTLYFPMPVDRSLNTLDAILDAIAPFRYWEARMEELLADGSEQALIEYSEIQEQYQTRGGYEIVANIEQEFHRLDLPSSMMARPFGSLSGGEQTRAMITALFVQEGYFALIDEPTNHLDIRGRQQMAAYLASKPGFLLVSHDRRFLDEAIDHVVSINLSDVRVNRGNYTSWKTSMEEIELHEERTRTNIERSVKQLKRAALQRREGSLSRERDKHNNDASKGGSALLDKGFIGHRAAKQMKKALNFERRVEGQLEEKQSLLKNKNKSRELKLETREDAPEILLGIHNLCVSFDEKPIIEDLSLSLHKGDRIAVVGPNGSGKSTLFNVIAGDLEAGSGVVARAGHVRYSRAYQHPLWARGEIRDHLSKAGYDETRFRQILGSFGVRGDVFDRPLETYSEGQRKKVDLCRSMMSDAEFFLWDEPMNYIDVLSREQIEKAILEFQPTIIFIEHDVQFVEQVATGILSL